MGMVMKEIAWFKVDLLQILKIQKDNRLLYKLNLEQYQV